MLEEWRYLCYMLYVELLEIVQKTQFYICHFLAEESSDIIEIEEDWEQKNCHRKREIVHNLVTRNSKKTPQMYMYLQSLYQTFFEPCKHLFGTCNTPSKMFELVFIPTVAVLSLLALSMLDALHVFNTKSVKELKFEVHSN